MRNALLMLCTLVLSIGVGGMTRAADVDEHAAHAESATAAPADPRRGMEEIEALMVRIAAISEPGQRGELLGSHLAAMRDQMRVIRAAAGQKTAAGKQDASSSEDAGGTDPHAGHSAPDNASQAQGTGDGKSKCGMMERKMKGGGMMKKHQQVEQRLDLLERMLQQLIEHEAIERELEDGD